MAARKKITDRQRKRSEKKKGVSERSLANLKPFQKGQSGNPAGNPRSLVLSSAYRAQLADINPDDPNGRTWAECIADSVIRRAVGAKASVMAAAEVADRTEGKPDQSITIQIGEMVKRAKEDYGIDVESDPILSALFAAAGAAEDGTGADRATGAGAENDTD